MSREIASLSHTTERDPSRLKLTRRGRLVRNGLATIATGVSVWGINTLASADEPRPGIGEIVCSGVQEVKPKQYGDGLGDLVEDYVKLDGIDGASDFSRAVSGIEMNRDEIKNAGDEYTFIIPVGSFPSGPSYVDSDSYTAIPTQCELPHPIKN